MELNSKVKELEDELKVLKAEIRNVLLDIREVILDRTNPISDDHQGAHITMDLNTTARAMAAEAGAREAMHAAEEAAHHPAEHAVEQAHDESAAADGNIDEADTPEESADDQLPEAEAPAQVTDEQPPEASDKPAKGKGRKAKGPKQAESSPEDADFGPERTLIPAMFRASAGSLSLAAWVEEAVRSIGIKQVDQVITIHRMCGAVPPNVSEALAHVQQLIRSSDEEEPGWLQALRDLERLT
jgi:chemotaxis protein histidine kinase CheA